MTRNYFAKFPQVAYNGKRALDITRRVKIPDKVRTAIDSYHTYDNSTGLRPDLVAEHYYGDPKLRWLVYMSGNIVDPYYQVYLTDAEFFDAMEAKYGSYEEAIGRVAFWRINWPSDEVELPDSLFMQVVQPEMRKYYQAVYLGKEVIGSWVRVKTDWVVNTNKVMLLTLDDEVEFTTGERVTITNDDYITTAEVDYGTGTSLYVKNVVGLVTAADVVAGVTSGVSAAIETSETVSQPIPAAETDFWEPVSYWSMEQELNNDRRFMSLIDNVYSREVDDDIADYLNGVKV